MKFIHIADVHLGRIPDQGKAWSEERKKELYESFYGVLEICEQQEVDLLLVAGDLFHRHPLLRELKELNYQFSKLSKTKVVMIAGNHDFIGEHSHYKDFTWCEQVIFLKSDDLEQITFPQFETTVYGFSYHHRDVIQAKYDKIVPSNTKGYHILLAHGGDEKNIPMNKRMIGMAGFDYVALGHIHKPEFITKTMAYSGSLEPLDRNEIGSHGYIRGELTTKEQVNIEFVPYSKRQYYHLHVQIGPEMVKGTIMDQLQKNMVQLGKQHIYKIILSGIREPDMLFNEKEFEILGNVIEVEDYSIPDYDFEALQYQNSDNVIGMFIEAIRQCGQKDEIADKALYYGMEALLKKNK